MRRIRRIEIRTIPQQEQRYDTCGDWIVENNTLHILVSQMPDPLHEQLVAVHELAEALACLATGISQEAVDAFDMGLGADLDEPGNSPEAPYHAQHVTATEIERRLAAAMGLDWVEYDAAVGDHGVRDANPGD